MNAELKTYAGRIRDVLRRLADAVDGLDEGHLNWRPSAPDANSVYVIATHTMGNLEAWVLGIACGEPVVRDRPAEFAASGSDAATLTERARDLESRFERSLALLADGALGEVREPDRAHWGIGPTHPITVREALAETIEHACIHLGQIDVTRDLALASAEG